MAEHSVFQGNNLNKMEKGLKSEYKKKPTMALPIAKRYNYLNSFNSSKTAPKKANTAVKGYVYNTDKRANETVNKG